MKFLALAFLAALGLMVEASAIKQLKPSISVLPVHPKHTYSEWQTIMASQKQIPQFYPGFKRGSKPQPDFAGKVFVPDPRIANGNEAERGQFPWQVALIVDNAWFCGGSLISDQWILTPAHCAGQSYYIILGTNRIDAHQDGEQIVQSRTSIIHENWNSQTLDNDICIVKIDPIQFTQYISPVKLPSRSMQDDFAGQTAILSGWGKSSDSSTSVSIILYFVELVVMTNKECAQTYGGLITPTKLCAATKGAQSTCMGDSGDPLVIRGDDGAYMEIGFVSFVSSTGCKSGLPAVFSRVTSYVNWIETHTGIRI